MGDFDLGDNQFTPDDVPDKYPVDRLMHDIALARMAVSSPSYEDSEDGGTPSERGDSAVLTLL